VRAAPLLDEHGTAIRAALARGESWPALPTQAAIATGD